MNVGVLGGGQLGRMLAQAAPAGVACRFLDPAADACAGEVGKLVVGAYGDRSVLESFADGLDVVTYEFENVPVAAVEFLSTKCPVFPPITALAAGQDRLKEKELFRSLGIGVPPFRAVASQEELEDAVEEIGLPAVLKTRRMGYDGKGQTVLQSMGDVPGAFGELGGKECLLEGFVAFERELSIIAVRGKDASTAFYPLTQNRHEGGMLRESRAPAPGAAALQPEAQRIASLLLDHFNYVGVLAIELFEAQGKLLVNELAPRVHNSGHWTIDGAKTSQFANHLRAICGQPLGSTDAKGECWMWNLIGEIPGAPVRESLPASAHVHLYGKAPRPGRKVGHITVCEQDAQTLDQSVQSVRTLLGIA